MSTSGEYGVQDDGSFRKKPIDVIREDVKQQFKNEIGQDIELRPSSPITQVINATTIEISKQWEAAEASYYASFYEDSFGEQLDKQLALAGFRREPLRGATGEVTFSRSTAASQDIDIPKGTVVQAPRTDTRPAIPFETTETATIFEGQSQVSAVGIEALEPWQTDTDEQWLGEETNLNANTITEFQDPVSGVDSVNNPNPTGDESLGYTVGRDRESDAEFKLRYQTSLAERGRATRDGIRSQLFAISDDVASVDIEEVYDTTNDDYGVRATILAPSVTDDQIAQAIYDSRAAGVKSFGGSSGVAEADDGANVTENFDRAAELQVQVDITLTTDSTFPSDGQTDIEDRIIQYIGGTDSEGLRFPGLGIGENVIYDQVFRRIINQQGVIELDLSIGPVGGTIDANNISVSDTEAATVTSSDINFL